MKVGIDIGGTSIRIGFIKENQLVKKVTFENDVENYEKMINEIFDVIDKTIEGEKLEFIGIASPGPLDIKNGVILNTPNLKNWNNRNIKQDFKNKYKVDVGINNDANVAALGQYLLKNESAEIESILYFTISTGFGAGFIYNGNILSGSTGKAMEVANAIPYLEGPNASESGIEYIASGKNIVRNLLALGVIVKNTKEAFEKYYDGTNEIVNTYFKDMKKRLVTFFTTAIYFFDPAQIILGGSVALNNKEFYKAIFEEVNTVLHAGGFNSVYDFAENIDEATLMGCTHL
jgi:glucokinase